MNVNDNFIKFLKSCIIAEAIDVPDDPTDTLQEIYGQGYDQGQSDLAEQLLDIINKGVEDGSQT